MIIQCAEVLDVGTTPYSIPTACESSLSRVNPPNGENCDTPTDKNCKYSKWSKTTQNNTLPKKTKAQRKIGRRTQLDTWTESLLALPWCSEWATVWRGTSSRRSCRCRRSMPASGGRPSRTTLAFLFLPVDYRSYPYNGSQRNGCKYRTQGRAGNDVRCWSPICLFECKIARSHQRMHGIPATQQRNENETVVSPDIVLVLT